MIWTTIFLGDFFSLETNFGSEPYLKERSLLRVTIERYRNANIEIYYPEIDQSMSYDKGNGVVIIDVTEYVRAYPQPSEPIVVSYFDDATPVEWYAGYFMNVDREIIPPLNYPTDGVKFLPPYMFLESLFGIPNSFEIYVNDYTLAEIPKETIKPFGGVNTFEVARRGSLIEIIELFRGFNTFEVARWGFLIYGSSIDGSIDFSPKPLLCNRQYALVQWQSRFGNTKRATWEVAEVKHSATDVVELVNIYGGWKSRKGSEVSVVLRLRDLTPYDYWYYSDIITSNDVRVALNEIDKDLDDSTIVDVVTKSATVQNSGVKTLEVELKYRKYECPI